MVKAWAIVAAAGSSTRMGPGLNKQLCMLKSKPVLVRTLQIFLQHPGIAGCVAVVAPDQLVLYEKLVSEWRLKSQPGRLVLTAGGSTRASSVQKGLAVLPADCTHVLVHDGARPLVEQADISRVLEAAVECGAAVLAVPVKDTVKQADGTFIECTPPRGRLWLAQTPQAFAVDILRRAYAVDGTVLEQATDDASLVERLGFKVKLVHGSYRNIKITTPEDLLVADALLEDGEMIMRVGIGYDVHRLVPDRPLVLGGVTVPWPKGLLGHSDADVLLHAIMDALLGAAALGDIGRHFPDSDEKYRGISSLLLLQEVGRLVAAAGYRVGNVDAVIIAQAPRLSPYIEGMRDNVAAALCIDRGRVGIKATTTEKLGFAGREEGIAAQAVAVVFVQ
ncbi:bifunctional 2-C-methyl-D-erythritol 4-phosphate cytidylyltransferase/2-C-methyl-D-erythritol 2,4-cyclodiphosphate synthase [Desulfurispora thermophila]|uniref:bifunctional 2-C-methyl-D-erythritol 4-phosphate cytidylyltransferase/2-C-methyl-D-erythritol 2,4-cyclodiphosphate synthase n=1 Tax=Desulfurispora thermophila TaxID=265470 RepID=UPI000361C917|nr:bifunctional 2-C-methyl-D-erythritol 4-phosphate cytidylyltransferase/2-C-methyl-D-erythritol 2,4-cyclodiphosphate synthase [Desulfurispora thermophila]